MLSKKLFKQIKILLKRPFGRELDHLTPLAMTAFAAGKGFLKNRSPTKTKKETWICLRSQNKSTIIPQEGPLFKGQNSPNIRQKTKKTPKICKKKPKIGKITIKRRQQEGAPVSSSRWNLHHHKTPGNSLPLPATVRWKKRGVHPPKKHQKNMFFPPKKNNNNMFLKFFYAQACLFPSVLCGFVAATVCQIPPSLRTLPEVHRGRVTEAPRQQHLQLPTEDPTAATVHFIDSPRLRHRPG